MSAQFRLLRLVAILAACAAYLITGVRAWYGAAVALTAWLAVEFLIDLSRGFPPDDH